MRYKVVLRRSDEGISISAVGLPGCHSQGANEAEALENIVDAIRAYLEVRDDLARADESGTVSIREVDVAD